MPSRILRSLARPWLVALLLAILGVQTVVLAESKGCFACHGPGGKGGVSNPGSEDLEVPSLDGGSLLHYVRSAQEIEEYVRYGHPLRLKDDRQYQDEIRRAALRMPAYGDRLSDEEIRDLVAFILAANVLPRPPESLVEELAGMQLVYDKGCTGCHGPSGAGGLSNPGSFKGYIPGWRGTDYDELVRDSAELEEWIDRGEIARLRNNPLAAWFLDRQVIKMPAYRDHLSAGEKAQMVAYIRWLRKQAPVWRQGQPDPIPRRADEAARP
ncbi:MAG TPA: c-type cytochrome [Candidatus Nitrosotenuis sp.]|nr:c-type cytochrome [Candidatus Nitrosotenuis sp.]